LVLKAQIGGYGMERVFMDAGSGINLIYAKTLRAMHISLEFLKPTDCSFHGIVPGSTNYPLGQITLNVCFGNCQNYKKGEARLRSHGLALPIPHDPRATRIFVFHDSASLYLPGTQNAGPRGIITVKGSFELSDLCDKEFHKMAQTLE
jgi:hypothetical protein